jgi:hypothetical protein
MHADSWSAKGFFGHGDVAGKGHEFKALFRAGPDVFNGVPNGVTAEGCVHVTINFHGNSLGDESDNCMSNVLKKAKRRPKKESSIGVQCLSKT